MEVTTAVSFAVPRASASGSRRTQKDLDKALVDLLISNTNQGSDYNVLASSIKSLLQEGANPFALVECARLRVGLAPNSKLSAAQIVIILDGQLNRSWAYSFFTDIFNEESQYRSKRIEQYSSVEWDGLSPIELAALHGNLSVFNILTFNGLPISGHPVHMALKGALQNSRQRTNFPLKILLSMNVDPYCKDQNGQTAFDLANSIEEPTVKKEVFTVLLPYFLGDVEEFVKEHQIEISDDLTKEYRNFSEFNNFLQGSYLKGKYRLDPDELPISFLERIIRDNRSLSLISYIFEQQWGRGLESISKNTKAKLINILINSDDESALKRFFSVLPIENKDILQGFRQAFKNENNFSLLVITNLFRQNFPDGWQIKVLEAPAICTTTTTDDSLIDPNALNASPKEDPKVGVIEKKVQWEWNVSRIFLVFCLIIFLVVILALLAKRFSKGS